MVINKRGMQWPAVLMSTVFSMILLIFGVMFVADVVKSVEVKNVDYIGHINYYALAERIMNSPDCAAWEEQFNTPSAVYTPHLGIIDAAKFEQTRISNCIKGNRFDMNLNYNKKKLSISRGDLPEDTTTDIFPVKVYENGVFYDGELEMAIK